MARVLLVCVAGVSGTFLARRIRQLDPSLETVVASFDGAAQALHSADVLLIAPQLADVRSALTALAPGVPAAVLPSSAFAVGGAESAVSTVYELLDSAPAPSETAPALPGASA